MSLKRVIDGESRQIDSRIDNYPPTRAFSDYDIQVDRDEAPEGVEIIEHL